MGVATAWALVFLEPGSLQGTTLAIVAIPLFFTFVYELAIHPVLAITCLMMASVVSRYALEVANLNARPEHVMAGLMFLTLPFIWNRRENRIDWARADKLLIAYMAANLVSSIFMSPDAKQTIKWAVQQILAILPYFWLRLLAGREDIFRRAFRILLMVATAEAAYAIAAQYSNLLFSTGFGMSLEQYGDLGAPFGTLYEPNFLGAYCAAAAVMMLTMYIRKGGFWYIAGYMLTLAGMALSFSRAALLTCIVALSFVLFLALRRRWVNKRMLLRIFLASAIVWVALSPVIFRSYEERFSQIEVGDVNADPNVLTRTVQLAMGVDQWLDHPILGNGTISFQLMFDWQSLGSDWEALGWLGNTEIRILHDTGIVGFGLFVAFVISLVSAARRVMRERDIPELLALMVGAGVYLLTFQATEGTVMAFCWVHLGLIGCAVAAYSRAEPLSAGQRS